MTVFLCILVACALDGNWNLTKETTAAQAVGVALHVVLILGLATLALVSYLS
jgi:hypothetical protein